MFIKGKMVTQRTVNWSQVERKPGRRENADQGSRGESHSQETKRRDKERNAKSEECALQ